MQWVKDLAFSLQQLGLLLWFMFDPWPRNSHIVQAGPKKNPKNKNTKEIRLSGKVSGNKQNEDREHEDQGREVCTHGGAMMTAPSNFSIKFKVKSTYESGSCEKFAMSGSTI